MLSRFSNLRNQVLSVHPTRVLTGQLANTTKIGRFARLLRLEILEKDNQMSLVVFGDNLIGKSIKAMCIAREGFDDDETFATLPASTMLRITPRIINPTVLQRDLVSIEYRIVPDRVETSSAIPYLDIPVSETISHEKLARKLHSIYLKNSADTFTVRCKGYTAAAVIVKALGLFNQRVTSHQLTSLVRSDGSGSNRILIFEVSIVDNDSQGYPQFFSYRYRKHKHARI